MKKIISGFHLIITTFIFIVVLVSCSSLKNNNTASAKNSENQVQEVKPEWLECKANVDCIKVKSFCKLPAVVHRKHKDTFLAFVKQDKNPIDCSKYKNINYEFIVQAACENKQCKLIIP